MKKSIDWIHLRLQQRNDRTADGRMAVDKLVKLKALNLSNISLIMFLVLRMYLLPEL